MPDTDGHTEGQADPRTITRLLHASVEGDESAVEILWRHIHDDLQRIAHGLMLKERRDHTLDSAGLVHEVYINFLNGKRPEFENRGHLFGSIARKMRHILIDHARTRGRLKRGGPDKQRFALDHVAPVFEKDHAELLDVAEALDRLEAIDPRKALIVHMRFFMDLTHVEIAALLERSEKTIKNEWAFARAWLHRELGGNRDD